MNANEPKAGHSFRINKGELNACLYIDGQANKGHLTEEGLPGQTEQGLWSRSQVLSQKAEQQAEVKGSDWYLCLQMPPNVLLCISFAK